LQRARHPGRAALTIDDGPHPESTPRFLAALADAGVHATFFVLADRVATWPSLLRDMVAAGHEIALHGPSHDPRLTWLHPREGAKVLRAAAQVLVDHGAPHPRWYRPPFGATSPRMYASVALAGLEVAWCSVRTLDGVPIRPETLRARCRRVVGTDIVLLHDGVGPAPLLLPEILAEWDQRGVRASSLTEALEEES
jgi:peptidoglycan/xylan/chitin deacetylase (PgdA/CDA1 family)